MIIDVKKGTDRGTISVSEYLDKDKRENFRTSTNSTKHSTHNAERLSS